ncbi:HEAT repeat domain-containing protein [Ktedonospora formicarum]|uniref:Uncharacterized protein n=1 Tax=Ktedonospora formicarum TaxID=2778364 RepID=A0A8J3I4C2_9CHLR|nr:hypothetical protein [Ktedonospora formicarum]GHO48471.1 hypothetical protein KSX_66340 [Ktedonospora formicarum]
MFQTNIPDAFTYASWTIYGVEDQEVIFKNFFQRWKGFTPDILAQVLQETKEDMHDKLFVLSALRYLAPAEAYTLLLPFVHSHKRSERWISTLSLGRLKEPMAFPLLQHLLLEELLNPNTLDNKGFQDADWYMDRRFEIALLLGDWGNPDAIAPLCEAIRQCWAMAANPGVYLGVPSFPTIEGYDTTASIWWDPFLSRLAYALGQLGAREALTRLPLPPAHFRLAKLYFLYGTLEINENILRHKGSVYIFHHPLVAQLPNGTIETKFYPLAQIMQVLQTHFELSVEEQDAFLRQAVIAYQQRKFERYPRNMPGYEDRFPPLVYYPEVVWLVGNTWKEFTIDEFLNENKNTE